MKWAGEGGGGAEGEREKGLEAYLGERRHLLQENDPEPFRSHLVHKRLLVIARLPLPRRQVHGALGLCFPQALSLVSVTVSHALLNAWFSTNRQQSVSR